MARQEYSGNGDPAAFRNFMQEAWGSISAEDFNPTHITERPNGTFPGEMGQEIANWQEKGYGRAIGIPPFGRSEHNSANLFRGAYALPYPSYPESKTKQVLLVFPTEESTKFVLVQPRVSEDHRELAFKSENETFHSEFDSLLLPSKKPFIKQDWSPDTGEDFFMQFMQNPQRFSVGIGHVTELLSEESQKLVLQKSLDMAERNRLSRMKIDDASLYNVLGDETSGMLAEVNDELGLRKNEIFVAWEKGYEE